MATPEQIFADINGRLTLEKAKKINSTYLFDIGGEGGGKWFADLTKAEGPWIEKKDAEAKCTIIVKEAADWVAIAQDPKKATSAFMQGKLKVKGDMSLAMKLQGLLS
jgi:hypothetical protein